MPSKKVLVQNFAFVPSDIEIAQGDTLEWENVDSEDHTATADNGEFDTGFISPGATSKPIVFRTAGTISYHCQIHEHMTGRVIVK